MKTTSNCIKLKFAKYRLVDFPLDNNIQIVCILGPFLGPEWQRFLSISS